MTLQPIKVMIVDDSAVVRSTLSELLQADPDIRVTAAVPDPVFALAKMNTDWPDVIISDLEMPRMDGVSFVRQLMRERPTPVVLCSSLTRSASNFAFQALDAGAFGLIGKSVANVTRTLHEQAEQIRLTVRAAAQVDPLRLRHLRSVKKLMEERGEPAARRGYVRSSPRLLPRVGLASEKIIALAMATGGLQALDYLLARLPADTPGILASLHMPNEIMAPFAERLNKTSQLVIKLAKDGELIKRGYVLMVPSDQPMQVRVCDQGYRLVNAQKKSTTDDNASDILLGSVAQAAGQNALGIIMTGVGSAGAQGLKAMVTAGAVTAAQDEATSVYYGMPKAAQALGAAQQSVSLYDIPEFVCRHAH